MEGTPEPAAYALVTTDHVLKLVFETLTDISFVPALAVVALRSRHFELFIGTLQLISSIMVCVTSIWVLAMHAIIVHLF